MPTKQISNFRSNLQKFYTENTKYLKNQCSNLLQLMSCACHIVRPSSTRCEAQVETQHQRCTIQSTKISTISSLVDKSKLNNNNNFTATPIITPPDPNTSATTTIPYDTQRENYGLYALKCNRNAIRRDTLLANLAQETKHKINVYPSPIKMSPEPYSDVNHEIFSPCQMAKENPETLNSLNYNREYYKIEFSEEGGLKGISSNRKNCGISATASTTPTAAASAIKPSGIVCDSNSKTFKTQIPAPPRKKKHPIAVPTTPDSSCYSSNSNSRGGGVGSAENLLSKSKPQARLLESCKQNDLSFCGKRNDAGCSTVAIAPSFIPPSHAKVNEQREVQRNNRTTLNTVGQLCNNNTATPTTAAASSDIDKLINLKKNPSELYRITEMSNKSRNLYDGNASKLFPILCDAAPNKTVVSAPKRHKSSQQRRKLTKQFSTTDSVNIFEPNANENAFDDFNDIISQEPVVSVGETVASTAQKNGTKIFSRFSSSSDSDEIIEFTKKSINRQTATANRLCSFASTDNGLSKTAIAASHHSSNKVDRKIIRENTVDLSSFAVDGRAVIMANKPQFINANQQTINNNPNNNVNNNNNNAGTLSFSSKLYNMSNDGYDDDQQMPKPTTADEGDGLCTQVLYNCNNDNANKSIICKDMERVKVNNTDIDYGRNVKRLPPQNRNVYKIINLATV